MASSNIATTLGVATYILNGNGRSIYDIADKFGISERTAYRILDRLQSEGYPLTNEERRNGKEKLWTMLRTDSDEFGNALPSSEFSDEEKILLHYIMAEIRKTEDVLPTLKIVRNKIANLLSQKEVAFPSIDYSQNIRRKLYPIENISSIAKLTTAELKRYVSIVLDAIRNGKKCRIEYNIPNKSGVLNAEISPIFAFFYDGGMYLQALLGDGSLRTYAFERISNIEKLADSTAMKPVFNPADLLTDPFGPFIGNVEIKAKLLIVPEQVQYIKERKWPDSVTIEDCPDGSAIFSVTTYGEYEFTNWILSQRSSVKVLEPEWLKESIIEILSDTAALYR